MHYSILTSPGQMLTRTFLPTSQEIVVYDDPGCWYDLIFVLTTAFCEVCTIPRITQPNLTE